MAVAFDADTAAVTVANGATTLTASNLTVGSGSNRAVAMMVWWGGATLALPTGLTVTWDSGGTNQAMTEVTAAQNQNANSNTACQLFALVAPTSGNKSLVLNWTGSREAHVVAISFTGVDQTSVAVAFPHGTSIIQNNPTASPCSVTITSAVGNMVIAGHEQAPSVWGAISDTVIASDIAGATFGAAFNYANGAATNTLTAAFTGTDRWGAMGCDVLAAASTTTYIAFGTPQLDGLTIGDMTAY